MECGTAESWERQLLIQLGFLDDTKVNIAVASIRGVVTEIMSRTRRENGRRAVSLGQLQRKRRVSRATFDANSGWGRGRGAFDATLLHWESILSCMLGVGGVFSEQFYLPGTIHVEGERPRGSRGPNKVLSTFFKASRIRGKRRTITRGRPDTK